MEKAGGVCGRPMFFGICNSPTSESDAMAKHQPKPYVVPVVRRYGAIEEITQAVLWPGSGDILSMVTESQTGVDVNDGCPKFGPLSKLCTGS